VRSQTHHRPDRRGARRGLPPRDPMPTVGHRNGRVARCPRGPTVAVGRTRGRTYHRFLPGPPLAPLGSGGSRPGRPPPGPAHGPGAAPGGSRFPPARPDPARWGRARILEVLVFAPHAQIRVGEAGTAAWISADAPGDLPSWLRPRDRSFLLQGWSGNSRTLDGEIPFAITEELSGTRAALPVDWRDFT